MTGPSVRGWLRQRHTHRAKIRAARRQADRERKAAWERLAGRPDNDTEQR